MQKVFFNPLKQPEPVVESPGDLCQRELAVLGSLAGLCLFLGLYPQPILDSVKWDVQQLTNIGKLARERVTLAPPPSDAGPGPSSPPPNIGLPNRGGGPPAKAKN